MLLSTLGCAPRSAERAYDPAVMDPALVNPAYPASLVGVTVVSDGDRLNGILYGAQGSGPHPIVLLLHGYPGEERNLDLAQAIRRGGWNVLFFHYRGAWGSEGAFSFGHAIEDVAAAVRLVQTPQFSDEHRIDPSRIVLVGHSMGGFLALTVGSELPEVDCVVSIAGGNLGLLGMAASTDSQQRAGAVAALDSWSGPIRGTSGELLIEEVVANAGRFDTTRRSLALSRKALLLIGGTRDRVTPMEIHHQPLVQALEAAGASRLTQEALDADHAFSDKRIALARLVVSWLDGHCR